MKKGDLVRSLRTSRGVGIVVHTYNDALGLMVQVRWPCGTRGFHMCGSLQIVEAK